MDAPRTAPVEAIDVFAGLLGQAEAAGPPEAFWSRLAQATCALAEMRRAVLFVYDDERQAVRAVGTHNIDLAAFAHASPTARQVQLARRALAEDRVVEVPDPLTADLPGEFHALLLDGTLTCTPISAGGRWIGVIIADRDRAGGGLTAPQRHTLWSLGKIAGLAATARSAVRQHERARQLDERVRFARELHDAVVQRLFGVSLALSGDGALPPETRARCLHEIQGALADLRAALQRPTGPPREVTGTLHEEIERLRHAHDGVRFELVDGADVAVPAALEAVAQSVLREAVRNAGKHADPTYVEIRLAVPDGAFLLEVVNDGVPPERRRAVPRGMGLRLAAFEALEHGGLMEFGPAGDGRWRVRLTVPLEEG